MFDTLSLTTLIITTCREIYSIVILCTVSCGSPPTSQANALYCQSLSTTLYGSQANYTCLSTTTNDYRTSTCQADGTWSSVSCPSSLLYRNIVIDNGETYFGNNVY